MNPLSSIRRRLTLGNTHKWEMTTKGPIHTAAEGIHQEELTDAPVRETMGGNGRHGGDPAALPRNRRRTSSVHPATTRTFALAFDWTAANVVPSGDRSKSTERMVEAPTRRRRTIARLGVPCSSATIHPLPVL